MSNGSMRMAVDHEGDINLVVLDRDDDPLAATIWIGPKKVLNVYSFAGDEESREWHDKMYSSDVTISIGERDGEDYIQHISFPYEQVNAAISMAMDSLLLDELHERGIELESNFAKALIALGIFKLTAINIIGDTPEKRSEVVQYEELGECFRWRNTIQGAPFWLTKNKEVSEYMEGLKHGT